MATVPTTIFGSQLFSGLGENHQHFTAICATQDIDLVTHLIPAGEYSITINVVMGEVNVFVPKHLRTVVDGTVLFGTSTFHDGEGGWKKFMRKFRYGSDARTNGPTLAFQDTSGEVRLRIRMNGLLGLVRIYRLAHEVQLVRPGMVAVGV